MWPQEVAAALAQLSLVGVVGNPHSAPWPPFAAELWKLATPIAKIAFFRLSGFPACVLLVWDGVAD